MPLESSSVGHCSTLSPASTLRKQTFSSSMLNARKREASDPILPTRQPKHPRVEESSRSTSSGLTVHSGLTARWSQLAREVVELASETIKAWGSRSSPSTSLPDRPPQLRRSPPPCSRPRPVHTAPPSHHPPPPRPAIPSKFHPHERPIQTEQTSLSSSLPSDQYSMQNFNPTDGSGSSLQSSTTGLTTVSHSTALPCYQTRDDLLASSVQQCRRAEEINNTLSQRKSKEHIYFRKVCSAMSAEHRYFRLSCSFPRSTKPK